MVIGLQSTGEAAADSLHLEPGVSTGFISTCRQLMLQFVEHHFPTTLALDHQQQQQAGQDPEEAHGQQVWGQGGSGSGDASPGGSASLSAQGQQGLAGGGGGGGGQVGEEDATSAQLKQSILERIAALELPPNFLDELIDKLGGASAVAEMTGRKARVVRDARQGQRLVYTLRAKPDSSEMDSLNIKEKGGCGVYVGFFGGGALCCCCMSMGGLPSGTLPPAPAHPHPPPAHLHPTLLLPSPPPPPLPL